MSSAITYKSITEYVKVMLGSPVVSVELHPDQINWAITQALGIYGTYKPVEKVATFPVIASQEKYTFTAEQVARGIIDVALPDPLRYSVSINRFDEFSYFLGRQALVSPGDFLLEKTWWESVKSIAGTDDDWEYIHNPTTGGGDLYLSPPPAESVTGMYIYVVDPTLPEVPSTDDDWINDYVLAICMEILGRIRNKFDDVQGAESSMRMDGQQLREEGKAYRTDLEEYLTGRGQIIPPIIG